jgi:uncharacterized phage-associated protein
MDLTFEFDPDRTVAAIVYLASREVPELTKWKICKLLYLADRMHLARYGRPITGDVYYALPWGPIPSYALEALDDENPLAMELFENLKKDSTPRYPTYASAPGSEVVWKDSLSESDLWALDQAVEQYGRMGFNDLSRVVHDTAAYKKAWAKRIGDRALMRFEDFFDDVAGAHHELLDELRDNIGADR